MEAVHHVEKLPMLDADPEGLRGVAGGAVLGVDAAAVDGELAVAGVAGGRGHDLAVVGDGRRVARG